MILFRVSTTALHNHSSVKMSTSRTRLRLGVCSVGVSGETASIPVDPVVYRRTVVLMYQQQQNRNYSLSFNRIRGNEDQRGDVLFQEEWRRNKRL